MFVPGGQGVGAIMLAAGTGSLTGGYISESNGGSYSAGWWGGLVTGAAMGAGALVGGNMLLAAYTAEYATWGTIGLYFGSFAVAGAIGYAGGFAGSAVQQQLQFGKVDLTVANQSGLMSMVFTMAAVIPGLYTGALNTMGPAGIFFGGTFSILLEALSTSIQTQINLIQGY